jgi:2-polyprenyl-3-methyl-5-hydroxy-6-metoxy-1,4-benzoquinol methylase
MDRKTHWEKVYTTKSHTEVSWFAEHIQTSLGLIGKTGADKASAIIDVGGGASTLVDDLSANGYQDLTVIDISGAALKIARDRLGGEAGKIKWMESDILESDFGRRQYDVWHDRAVFHFLTTVEDRAAYRQKVLTHVKKGGFVVLSIFADDGPLKCSMLDIKRHSGTEIEEFFGNEFEKVHEDRTSHITPAKVEQKFVNVILKRLE